MQKNIISPSFLKSLVLISSLLLLNTSCDNSNRTWGGNDVYELGELITEVDLGDVMVGSDINIALNDTLLIINDTRSSEMLGKVFKIFDNTEIYIGDFIHYGPGPYEVGSIGKINIFPEKNERLKAQVFNYSQNCILEYDIDSALIDLTYRPARVSELNGSILPSNYFYINDTLGFARKIVIDPSGYGYTQSLGKYNLSKNELIDFAPEEHVEQNNSQFAVSTKYNIVAEVSINIDMIKIYSFDGQLLHKITGAQYSNKINKEKSFFTNATFADDLILAVYSGGDWAKEHIGTKLVVIDKDGNYITTLDLGKQIRDLKYHEPSGMLYLTFINDDMQIGKLNLKEALDAAK